MRPLPYSSDENSEIIVQRYERQQQEYIDSESVIEVEDQAKLLVVVKERYHEVLDDIF